MLPLTLTLNPILTLTLTLTLALAVTLTLTLTLTYPKVCVRYGGETAGDLLLDYGFADSRAAPLASL